MIFKNYSELSLLFHKAIEVNCCRIYFRNSPSPINFTSVNLSNGTHSRNLGWLIGLESIDFSLNLNASYIVSLINWSMLEFPLVPPRIYDFNQANCNSIYNNVQILQVIIVYDY